MTSQFKFNVGIRVLYKGKRVKIVDRTIESSVGKTYLIKFQNGRLGGFVLENELAEINPHRMDS